MSAKILPLFCDQVSEIPIMTKVAKVFFLLAVICVGVVVRSSGITHHPGGDILLGVTTPLYKSLHQITDLYWTDRLIMPVTLVLPV